MEAINVKEAAKNGAAFLANLYEGAEDILVEEVEMDEQQRYWLITFSYLYNRKQSDPALNPLRPAASVESLLSLYPSRERNYKTLKIDAKTGAVISMKIRELQG